MQHTWCRINDTVFVWLHLVHVIGWVWLSEVEEKYRKSNNKLTHTHSYCWKRKAANKTAKMKKFHESTLMYFLNNSELNKASDSTHRKLIKFWFINCFRSNVKQIMKKNLQGLFNYFSPFKIAYHILICTFLKWPGRYICYSKHITIYWGSSITARGEFSLQVMGPNQLLKQLKTNHH